MNNVKGHRLLSHVRGIQPFPFHISQSYRALRGITRAEELYKRIRGASDAHCPYPEGTYIRRYLRRYRGRSERTRRLADNS